MYSIVFHSLVNNTVIFTVYNFGMPVGNMVVWRRADNTLERSFPGLYDVITNHQLASVQQVCTQDIDPELYDFVNKLLPEFSPFRG